MVYDRRYVRRVTRMISQILLVTAVGALVRILFLAQHSLWLDEAISLEIVNRNSLPSLMAFVRQWDVHPPLYYQLLFLWTRVMGDELAMLRLPSAVFGLLTVPAVYVLALLWTRRRTAFLAALLFALSPFQVQVAQEARMYSLLTLWAVLAFIFLVLILRQPDLAAARMSWLGLAVCQAGAAYTHNAGGFYLAATLNLAVLWWLWRHRRGQKFDACPALNTLGFGFNWGVIQVMAVLMWLPWSSAFLQQARRILQDFWVQPLDVYSVWGTLSRMTFAFLPLTPEIQAIPAVLMLLLALWGLIRVRHRPVLSVFLLAGCLVPVALALLGELIKPIWHERSLNWISVPLYMMVAIGLAGADPPAAAGDQPRPRPALWQHMQAAGQMLLVLVPVLLQLWGLGAYYQYGEREAWQATARHVAAAAQEGDRIMFHAHWVQLPFMYHYDRLAAPTLHQMPVPEAVFAGTVAEPRMTEARAAAVQAALEPATRTWLVYSHDWYTDPDGLVLGILDDQLSRAGAWTFPAIRVFLHVPE